MAEEILGERPGLLRRRLLERASSPPLPPDTSAGSGLVWSKIMSIKRGRMFRIRRTAKRRVLRVCFVDRGDIVGSMSRYCWPIVEPDDEVELRKRRRSSGTAL
jgi:hypothetical protein